VRKATPDKFSPQETGCEFCPLDKARGIHKVMGSVAGREVFIWGLAPGREENEAGQEFVGDSGKLLWQELDRVGIARDMCDIQNAVRCFPADHCEDKPGALRMRDPSKREIHCCSKFTDEAIQRSQARLHLIFGKLAATAILGDEYCEGRKTLRSEKLKGNVVCMWHPSYLVRQGYRAGGTRAPNDKFARWQLDFRLAASMVGRNARDARLEATAK
jgi:uracil-DNA glycosylase